MKKNNISVGIDIGTNTIKVVVLGHDKEKNSMFFLSTGSSETVGVRQGYITNIDSVANSIKKAVAQAESVLGYKITKANISIGGISLSSITSTSSIIISRSDQEITSLDITKVLALSEENLNITNKKIIHVYPISYKLDGKDIYGRPEGMIGEKLEVKTIFITCSKQNIEDLVTAFGLANIDILDIIASPIASSSLLLNTKQKTAGCALLDIGAETVSLSIFENNMLLYLHNFAIGSMDITKDIALGFKIGLDEAESIKLGSVIGGNFPRKKIDEIIDARMGDIFELVDNHLKRLKRSELLPAGIILSGGGANIENIVDFAKKTLKLPAVIGFVETPINNKLKIKDSSWHVAYGLAYSFSNGIYNNSPTYLGDNAKQVKSFFKSLFNQLLP